MEQEDRDRMIRMEEAIKNIVPTIKTTVENIHSNKTEIEVMKTDIKNTSKLSWWSFAIVIGAVLRDFFIGWKA